MAPNQIDQLYGRLNRGDNPTDSLAGQRIHGNHAEWRNSGMPLSRFGPDNQPTADQHDRSSQLRVTVESGNMLAEFRKAKMKFFQKYDMHVDSGEDTERDNASDVAEGVESAGRSTVAENPARRSGRARRAPRRMSQSEQSESSRQPDTVTEGVESVGRSTVAENPARRSGRARRAPRRMSQSEQSESSRKPDTVKIKGARWVFETTIVPNTIGDGQWMKDADGRWCKYEKVVESDDDTDDEDNEEESVAAGEDHAEAASSNVMLGGEVNNNSHDEEVDQDVVDGSRMPNAKNSRETGRDGLNQSINLESEVPLVSDYDSDELVINPRPAHLSKTPSRAVPVPSSSKAAKKHGGRRKGQPCFQESSQKDNSITARRPER